MTPKQTLLLNLFFTLAILLFSIVFLLSPTLKDIKHISQNLFKIESDLRNIEKRVENLRNFKRQFPSLRENLSLFEKSIVDKELPIDFINFLENVASSNQILFEISLLNKGKDLLSFQINAIGSPQNIFRFLEKIENCPYLLQGEKIVITKMSETELKTKGLEKFPLGSLKSTFSIRVQTK